MNRTTNADELALAIGQVTMAWSGAHEMLLLIFKTLGGMSPEVAEEIFLGRRNDRDQRRMVLKTAKIVLKDKADAAKLTELAELIAELDRLADDRNKTVHTMWHGVIVQGTEGIKVFMNPRSASAKDVMKLIEKPLPDWATHYKELAVDVKVIGLKLLDLHRRLLPPDESPTDPD